MKEEWLMPGAVVPVDAETTAALVSEIKRLIGVVGSIALSAQPAKQRHIAYVCPQCHWTLEEQPAQQQEPVLCINPKVIDPATGKVRNGTGALTYSDTPCAGWSLPLYTSPQRKPWVGLTEGEIENIWEGSTVPILRKEYINLARAIEAKLKEKNT